MKEILIVDDDKDLSFIISEMLESYGYSVTTAESGEEAFKLGDIWQGVTNTATQCEFAACNVYARPDCADCWAKLYCSGGCAANAYHATGSVTGVYEYGCELFRKRMECAIMVEVAKTLGDDAE